MGWAEKASREAAEAKAGLSTEARGSIVGAGLSPWLEDKLREFGGSLIHAANQLAAILNPPRLVGADGNSPVQRIDPLKTILLNQMLMMRALAALNDAVLVLTTGTGVLKPLGRSEPENGPALAPEEPKT